MKKSTSLSVWIAMWAMVASLQAYGQDTIRCLAIGNSFSEDAIERYLYPIGKSGNVIFILGNLHRNSANLEMHWKNIENDAPDYSYRHIDKNGARTSKASTRLDSALTSERWDYITLQQASELSGKRSSYDPYLSNLIAYLKEKSTNPHVKIAFHQTWAYAKDCTSRFFADYDNDQEVMYQAIVDALHGEVRSSGIHLIIPSGTVIQKERAEFGDIFCRDGTHLSEAGKFAAACTWYQALTGKPVVECSYSPGELVNMDTEKLKSIVHSTVSVFLQPSSVRTPPEEGISYIRTSDNSYYIEASLLSPTAVKMELITLQGYRTVLFDEPAQGDLKIPFQIDAKGIYILQIQAENQFTKTFKILNF